MEVTLTMTLSLILLVLILPSANPNRERTIPLPETTRTPPELPSKLPAIITTNATETTKTIIPSNGIANSSSEITTVKESSTSQSTRSARVPVSLELYISIDLNFTEELTDPSSPEYIRLKTESLKVLREAFHTFPGFVGVLIKGFRNGSVVVDFLIEIESDRNLTAEAGTFRETFVQLQTATIEGTTVNVDVTVVMNDFSAVAEALDRGKSCDATQCTSGHFCSLHGETFVCLHKCQLVGSLCYNKGGCLYDPVLDEPVCRCQRESKLQKACSEQNAIAESESNVVAIVSGVLTPLAVVVGGVVGLIYYCRNNNDDGKSCNFYLGINCCNNGHAGNSSTKRKNEIQAEDTSSDTETHVVSDNGSFC